MTVIKGTFPVRFRVDGKDGEGLWVRYAVTLDKWDDTLQKSYPSNMYTLPTDDCIYIGIAVGAGSAPTEAIYYDWLKFVGVDGQSFIIRGVCEEVYSYDVFYDEVEKVVGKVYLLEDYDSDTFNALAVRWTENGAEDLGAVDGDAYVKSSNRVLFVKNKNLWQDLGSIQGPKGDPGDPGKDGEDAVSYKLSSSISALPLNNDGSPQITSFTLSAVMRKGATVVPFDENYILFYYIYHSASIPPDNKGQWLSSSISSMTVDVSNINDITSISCSLKYRENNALKTLDSFDILPIKAGAAGVSYFPNMRGYWKLGATYQWQGMSRDMVVWRADGDDKPYLYAVKTAGTTVKKTLLSPDKNTGETGEWEKADSPFSMLFANFVYTDNASVGGFVFSEEQMRSTSTEDGNSPKSDGSNCKILIDGSTGFFRARNAEIKGKINATSGTFENVEINNSCQIIQNNGKGWFLVGANAQSDRPESWWLGYSGELTGQFTMQTSYDDGSNHPPTAKISARTPNIQSGSPSYSPLLELYANISQPLASFYHDGGMMVRICNSLGEGIRFTPQASSIIPLAFCGKGHGGLDGVIQGYKLNVISSGQIDILNGNTVYCDGVGTSIVLPTLKNCQDVLGTNGSFALDLCIIGALGAYNFNVYGSSKTVLTNCQLLDNNHNAWSFIMSAGDVILLKLIYNGSSFYAYRVSHFN